MMRSYYSKLVFLILGVIAAVFPLAVLGAVSGSRVASFSTAMNDLVRFFQIITMFYFVIFMPLIAFLLVLVVPFYVFRLQRMGNFARIVLLTLIVGTLVFVSLQFFWLNINIEIVKQLYSYPAVWIFSWLVHVAIIVLIIAPMIYEEELLFVSLMVSLITIIVASNYVGYRFLTLLRLAVKS